MVLRSATVGLRYRDQLSSMLIVRSGYRGEKESREGCRQSCTEPPMSSLDRVDELRDRHRGGMIDKACDFAMAGPCGI